MATGKIDDLENRTWHRCQQLMDVLLPCAGNRRSLGQTVFTSGPALDLLLPYTDIPPDFRLTSCLCSDTFPLSVSLLLDAWRRSLTAPTASLQMASYLVKGCALEVPPSLSTALSV